MQTNAAKAGALDYLAVISTLFVILGFLMIFRNTLQGMGKAVIPMISSIVELALRAFAAIYLAAKLGYIGICYASPIAWVGGSAVVSGGYFWVVRRIGCRYLYNRRQITVRGRR